jgi:glycosyltransferase involved in cell wall biosynthesis
MSKAPLRVLQLIDSLNAGGSERMAVQLANLLNDKIDLSAIVCSRATGILEKEIYKDVRFLYLKKTKALDVLALKKLFRFVTEKKINIIHAHSTSYFLACQLKLLQPQLKIIWHDHYGNSDFLENRQKVVLAQCSYLFDSIISVNNKLKAWSEKHLNCKKVHYLENFTSISEISSKNNKADFRILQIANLRPQKDHLTSLKAIQRLTKKGFQFKVDYIGDHTLDPKYFKTILEFVNLHHLNDTVTFHGKRSDVIEFLKMADVGILSSESEGLPLSLLEYAQAHLPVVVTDVGQCKEVVRGNGKVVEPKNPEALAEAIEFYITNEKLGKKHGDNLHLSVKNRFSPDKFVSRLFEIYN